MEFYPLLFAALHLMLLLSPSASVMHSNLTDLSALLAFRARLSDPLNVLTTNWTTDTSFCTWTGVSCSRRRQRVVSLRLEGASLYGTIAPDVSNMSFLSHLNLLNNSLVGPIPASLSRLPRLKVLLLSLNQLSGSIPPAIFNMSLLTHLFLGWNNLSGDLPSNSSFPSILPLIQALSLPYNRLSGNIPSSLFYCYHLQLLSLSFNQFTGTIPMEIGNLKQLALLYLGTNSLTGTIPASLGNLANLLVLEMANNNLSGVIPGELGGLLNLQKLKLHTNGGITGPIPISISNISSLEFIDMQANELTGPILVDFGRMRQLQILRLDVNRLSGGLEFLGSLSNCKDLRELEVEYNGLVGPLPNTIGNLSTNLIKLFLSENHFIGKIPNELGNLSSLQWLELGDNELAGTIPSEIARLESLQWLDLRNNKIHGSIPYELGRLQILKLYLNGNVLSGSIPQSLGNISSLERWVMSSNELSSGIPRNIGSLTSLIELNLSYNFLNGSLPSEIGNIKSLDVLDISMNQLSGEIPDSLKELQMLTFLDLSNNSLNGTIPQSFDKFIILKVLNLSCNKLSGAIPDSLANIRNLTNLNLSFNKLEGEIPNRGAFLNLLTITTLVGNVALCGAPSLGFPPCSKNTSTRVHSLEYILLAISFTIILVACFCFLLISRRKKAKGPDVNTPFCDDFRLISYHELVSATENFCESNLLGRGSFGSVYKGVLDNGLLTAVKVFNLEVGGASRSFDIECGALHMVRHRNLVKIFSTCSNLDFKALILQFIPNGSLERWLYSHNYCLNLLHRINIVIDVASALEYLHHQHPQVILHCDLKPSNILLDEDMTAHVSDFGIAKLLVSDSQSLTSASLLGTIGYMAPEYSSTGRVSRKGDVYSFGILLLEIFTRRKPSDPMFVGESSLRKWVFDAYSTDSLDIVDRNLLKDGDGNEIPGEVLISTRTLLSSIMELGILCSMNSPKERPTMIDVGRKLQKQKANYLAISPVP